MNYGLLKVAIIKSPPKNSWLLSFKSKDSYLMITTTLANKWHP